MKRSLDASQIPVVRQRTPSTSDRPEAVADQAPGQAPEQQAALANAEPGASAPASMTFPGPFAFQPRPPAMRDNSGQSSSHAEPAPAPEEKPVTGVASARNTDSGVSAVNPQGFPPLILAAHQGDLAKLEALLQDPSVDVNQIDRKHGGSALVAAASSGQVAVVARLVEAGANLALRCGPTRQTALMHASYKNRLKVVECLLAAGAPVNLADQPTLGTALIYAATGGYLDVVNLLLAHKDIAVDQTDATGMTALHCAAANNKPKVVASLLAAGARPNLADDGQRLTALMNASWKGHVDVVKALLADKRTTVDQVDASGASAMHWAADANRPVVVARLLAAGANGNLAGGLQRRSPLIAAVVNGHGDVVKTLLTHKVVAVDQADSAGRNALHWAASQNKPEIVACLLQAGATVNMLDGSQRRTALILASSAGHVDVVKKLLRHRDVALNEMDTCCWSALHLAAHGNKLEVAACLLEAGANVNLSGQSSRTALMLAAAFGHVDVVKLLIRYKGFNVFEKDATGQTALHIAVACNKPAVVACLLAAGANLKLANGVGISAERSAIIHKQAAVLEVMMQYGLTLRQQDFSDSVHSAFYITMSDLDVPWQPLVGPLVPFGSLAKFSDIPDQPLAFIDLLLATVEPGNGMLQWLRVRDVRVASALPVVGCLASLPELWPKLANNGQAASTQQKRLICAAALNMLPVLTADGKALAPYKAAGISAAGVERLSTVATHQLEGIIGVAENVLTTMGTAMVNEMVRACMAASVYPNRVDIDALRAMLVDAGWLSPVAQAIAVSWKSALAALEAGPAALPASSSIKPASTSWRGRVEREAPRLFAQALLREVDSPSPVAALRILIGDSKAAEPIDILFQAQCDQLRQFCEQTDGEG